MNKKQCFKNMWIPLEKRFPPNTEEIFLGWNEKTNSPILASGIEINRIALFPNLKDRENLINTYFHIIKWMTIYKGD